MSDRLWVNAKADSTHFAGLPGLNKQAIRPPKAGRTKASAPEVSNLCDGRALQATVALLWIPPRRESNLRCKQLVWGFLWGS